ncbi:MAG TPA: hypothetical protein VLX91_13825 [Candidatus Acidoferrales bacterium]|nr:hypothetical protein [Candidatus Acidoferrales bacterium]
MSKKILLIGLFFIAEVSYGQNTRSNGEYSKQATDKIAQLIQTRYGSGYELYVVAVDTLIGRVSYSGYADFCDPRHLLKGALIFNAVRPPDYEDSSIVGIYQNGAVRWMSEPIISGYLQEIIGTIDLLGDGTIDILSTWDQAGTMGDQVDLWIINWNGGTGRIINDFDPQTGRSSINGLSSYFEATNLNNSKVSEILSSQHSSDSTIMVEYDWNGSKYTESSVPTKVTQSCFLPANLMNASLSVKVDRERDGFRYIYSVFNSNDSRQAVLDVFLEGVSDWTGHSDPTNWTFIPWSNHPIAEWVVGGYPNAMVLQGQTKDDFVLSGEDNPVIVNYHLQGDRIPPVFQNESELTSDELFLNDMRTNSISGKTIGNSNFLDSLDLKTILDTLISYKHQSVTLGWLKEDKTHKQDCDEIMNGRDWYKKGDFEKFGKWNPTNDWDFDRDWNNGIVEVLDRRLDRAKTELSKRDSVGAKRDLQIFVMEVELLNNLTKKLEDRKQNPIMTSEAYALLKYNAEYLIDKLPEGRGKN